MVGEPKGVREAVTRILEGARRVERQASDISTEALQADLENLRAAVRELQEIVVLLAEELDRR